MIAIVDYDAGNMKSVEKALEYLGETPVVTRDAETILGADKVILPGVGSFKEAMDRLHQYGLVEPLRRVASSGKPFLGICLGLQLMFESSEESPGVEGLSILKGKIVRFPDKEGFKIPHMGLNSLKIKEGSRLFANLPANPYVYFVHSYYLQAEDENDVAATTEYMVKVDAACEAGNIFACQFHPEKSGTEVGLQILKNFINL